MGWALGLDPERGEVAPGREGLGEETCSAESNAPKREMCALQVAGLR